MKTSVMKVLVWMMTLVAVCASCAYDELSMPQEPTSRTYDSSRSKQEQSAYEIALSKLPALYLATGNKRMSAGIPVIASSQPL